MSRLLALRPTALHRPPTLAAGAAVAVLAVLGLVAGPVGSAAGAVPAQEPDRHTVQRGETLGTIAARNHTTVRALAEANGITNANRILIGQVLVIPGASGAPATAPAAPVVHVVAPGEHLNGIAARYGTTASALAEANGIRNRNLVRIGARLTVPGAAGAPAPATTAPPAPPATTAYTVTAGDTLAGIASRHGTTVSALIAANGLSNPNLVRIGQQLAIPAAAPGAASPGGSAYATTGGSDGRTGLSGTHTVTSGETLRSIAARYGVTVEALAAANGIPRPWDLYAGARLQLTAANRLPVDVAQCPVPGATFVNDWGFPRSGGRAHAGTDMFAARGTAVLAPVAGTVSYATGALGGRQFRLVGDDGMVYLGSHLDAFATAGRVGVGTPIGYVGNSGNAAGSRPHLHFEIHPDNGAAMNPFPVVSAAC